MTERICRIDGCDKPLRSKGMCWMHATRAWRHGDPSVVITKPTREQLFEAGLPASRPDDQCWEWQGATRPGGYGRIGSVAAHRFSWARVNGPIPAGMEIRHRCDNPPCVNPAHLEPGTHSDNMRDMHDRGRHRSHLNGKCGKGHAMSGDNVGVESATGKRYCRTCSRARAAAAYLRSKERRNSSPHLN